FTAADVDLPPSVARFGSVRKDMARPRLADGTVRFVGDAVAAVVAETRAEAVDAAELVFVDYDPLPVVVDPEEALRGEVLLGPEQVRVIAPDVGGGFGAKIFGGTESVVVAWLARRLERPVRWVETRSESMLALEHGRGMLLDFELGGSRDGKLEAYRLRALQD